MGRVRSCLTALALLCLRSTAVVSSESVCSAAGTCHNPGYRARGGLPKLCSLPQHSGGPLDLSAVFDHMDAMLRKSLQSVPVSGISVEDVVFTEALEAAGDAVRHSTGASYLFSWVVNLSKAAHASLGMLLALGQTLSRRLPVMWSDAVFEITGVPYGEEGSIVLSQEPLGPQTLLCAMMDATSALTSVIPGHRKLMHVACAYERSAVPGRVLSRPCESGGSGIRSFTAGSCLCDSGICHVRVGPLRHPEIHYDGPVIATVMTTSSVTASSDVATDVASDANDSGASEPHSEGSGTDTILDDDADGSSGIQDSASSSSSSSSGDSGIANVLDGGKTLQCAGSTKVVQLGVSTGALPSWLKPVLPGAIPWHALALLIGVAFVGLAEPLSESIVFHYALSAVLGSCIAALFVAYVLYNFGKKLFDTVPGGSTFRTVGAAALVSAPLSAALYRNMLGTLFRAAITFSFMFWQDGLFEISWAGKAYFIGSAILGMLFTWYMSLFKEPSDGGLLNSWGNGQANLRRIFTYLGVYCLLSSSADLETAVCIAGIALYKDTAVHICWRIQLWLSSKNAQVHCEQMSETEYDQAGIDYTLLELARLRQHLQANPTAYSRTQQGNWNAISHFVQGMPHVNIPDARNRRQWRCSIQ